MVRRALFIACKITPEKGNIHTELTIAIRPKVIASCKEKAIMGKTPNRWWAGSRPLADRVAVPVAQHIGYGLDPGALQEESQRLIA